MSDGAELYIELLKKSVGNFIYDDDLDLMRGSFKRGSKAGTLVSDAPAAAAAEHKKSGLIWPSRAHTMIGLPRLNNIQQCVSDVLENNIPGDFIETGVWRGGATIFMRGILKAHGITDRTVWVADSFEGLPASNPDKYPEDSQTRFEKFADLAVSLEQVKENFRRYDLLDNQVKFLKGWFSETLPKAPIDRLAVLRLDGDLYESTMDALVNLYDRVSEGGYIIVDDYHSVAACKAAIQDFRAERKIKTKPSLILGGGVFWKK